MRALWRKKSVHLEIAATTGAIARKGSPHAVLAARCWGGAGPASSFLARKIKYLLRNNDAPRTAPSACSHARHRMSPIARAPPIGPKRIPTGGRRPIGLRRITAGTPGKASVPVVLVLASLRRLAVCRSGPGRRNRINNDRLAHRRWLFGGVALGNGAPNGLGARARSVGRFLSLLGVHGWSGDLAAVVEFNVRKWQRVPRLRRPGSPARPSALPLRLGVPSPPAALGVRTSGCGPWTPSPGRVGARPPFPSANANPSALAATNPAP